MDFLIAPSKSIALNGVAATVAAPRIALLRHTLAICASSESSNNAASRRMALALVAGVVAVGVKITPPMPPIARALYVFGAPKMQSGFKTVTGDGFKVDIPSKWNLSKETKFPSTTLRYEVNFHATSNMFVSVTKAAKASITNYGPPDKFLAEVDCVKRFLVHNIVKQAVVRDVQEASVYDDHCPLSKAVKHVGLGLRRWSPDKPGPEGSWKADTILIPPFDHNVSTMAVIAFIRL